MRSEPAPRAAADAQHGADAGDPGLVISRISAHRDLRRITLEVGYRDIRIRRSLPAGAVRGSRDGCRRSSISAFSKESRRRLLFVALNFPDARYFLTLTYPSQFPLDGVTVKHHWKRLRQWLQRNGAAYGLWVLEFQERGAPHIHAFVNEWIEPQRLSEAWYRIVGSNDPKHLAAGTNIQLFRKPSVMGSYLYKYASKSAQKDVPAEFSNVGRFWGTWGSPKIATTVSLPLSEGKVTVRTIRRAYFKERQDWQTKSHFRDNGTAGFIAWDSAYKVSRITAPLLHGPLTERKN